MDKKKHDVLGGGVHQLNNNQLFNLQLFGNTLNYTKVNNPYDLSLNKLTYTKGDIEKVHTNLSYYHLGIPNYSTITTLPEENAKYIKEVSPTVIDCSGMLSDCSELISVDTTGWDTSNVTNMNQMFDDCQSLTTLDVSKWNTNNVTDMASMFYDCSALTTLDISNWDTSKVTNMSYMFYECQSLTTLDVSKWNTSNVTNMSHMFDDCSKLQTLDVSKWNTSNVTNMSYMFYECYKLTTLDISNWDTSNVTNMDEMFGVFWLGDKSQLTTIKGTIDMKSCISYTDMFDGCGKLTGVKIKNPPSGITTTSGIGGLKAGQYEIVE